MRISKLELKTRQRLLQIEKVALPGQLESPEGRKEIFKQFTTHNDPGMVAAKIRIIQKYSQIPQIILNAK